ncbi:unnamed protein product [Vicia faba]|uniref:Cupin type-1 domain-containing protein n=1 Tax=Vicia faba TaxID=3906 RepID=A0AAV0YH24_VICFA|nr:unnamed protein product [Vicia faba]
MAATIIKLFMLLGVALLASVCVSSTSDHENPFIFKSNRFQSLYENENGRIRLLQRFDKRSKIFENLQNYRILEYKFKPRTLLLPQYNEADFILVVLNGKAILTVLNSNDRNSFNLEVGDTIKLPAGTIAYLANRDDNEDLRVLDLDIPVNRPGQLQSFLLSGTQNQPSFLSGFSKNILEASFNTNYEEIEEVLLEEQEQDPQHRRILTDRRQEINKEDVIVKVSKEQIEELGRNAKTSSKKSVSSKSEPFNLRSRSPIYSNKFGKFFEITPEKNPQLQDLNIFVNSVEIKEGSLLLPNYNSRAIVIVTVNEGKGDIELVGQRNENQEEKREENDKEEEQKEEEISKQVQRYRARLSPGDVFVIPAGHPYAINASSELNLIGFGINAENNQRNFLAGEEDNVISQIQRPVKEIVFPGSSKEIDRLLKNQKESYFANAQPLQRE